MSAYELAPTADIPSSKAPEAPVFYGPCPHCQQDVLRAFLDVGTIETVVLLETSQARPKTYCVAFGKGDKRPIAYESAAYPVHRCQP